MSKNLGIILIVIGAIMLIWTGVTYTKKKKIIDAGPIQVSVDQKQTITVRHTWARYCLSAVL